MPDPDDQKPNNPLVRFQQLMEGLFPELRSLNSENIGKPGDLISDEQTRAASLNIMVGNSNATSAYIKALRAVEAQRPHKVASADQNSIEVPAGIPSNKGGLKTIS